MLIFGSLLSSREGIHNLEIGKCHIVFFFFSPLRSGSPRFHCFYLFWASIAYFLFHTTIMGFHIDLFLLYFQMQKMSIPFYQNPSFYSSAWHMFSFYKEGVKKGWKEGCRERMREKRKEIALGDSTLETVMEKKNKT